MGAGNGLITGQDLGFVISKSNVSLIGSGSDFVYDAGKFKAPGKENLSGTTLIAATTAPVITNTQTDGDPVTETDGNAIHIIAPNAYISGIDIKNPVQFGIYADIENGNDYGDIAIHNVNMNQGVSGIKINTMPGGTVQNIYLSDVVAANMAGAGINLNSLGYINNIEASSVTTNNNGQQGLLLNTGNGTGTINNAYLNNIIANNNVSNGILLQTPGAGGIINKIYAENLTTNNNSNNGISIRSAGITGKMGDVDIRHVEAIGNGNNNGVITAVSGVSVAVSGTAAGRNVVNHVNLTDVTATGNTQYGINVSVTGILKEMDVDGATLTGNTLSGLNVLVNSGGTLSSLDLNDIHANANVQHGIVAAVQAADSELTAMTLTNSEANGNGTGGTAGNGIQVTTAANSGSVGLVKIDNVSVKNNRFNGILLQTAANTSLSASVQNSTITGNQRSGIYANDDTTLTYKVDLGGGTLGSIGNNILTGNRLAAPATYGDIQVDLDLATDPANGTLSAKNNWWGQAGGPIAGQIKSDASPNNGAVDSTSPLAVAP